jgi:adenine C2-methylase RlmN of 23S rRNA A2503 and tRNA A37
VDQVVLIDGLAEKYYKQGLTNIVYMGMGEPLLNYANTLRSAERIWRRGRPGHEHAPHHREHGRHRQDDPQAGR